MILVACQPRLLFDFFPPSSRPPSRREGGEYFFISPGATAPGTPGLSGARHWLDLPARHSAGGLLSCLPANLAVSLISCPHPPVPLPGGKGETKVIFMQGASPLASPGAEPGRHLQTLLNKCPSGEGLRPLRGGVWVAFRYPAGAWRLRRGIGEQSRQPRRGGIGGEELRRLRWSSPPGQG